MRSLVGPGCFDCHPLCAVVFPFQAIDDPLPQEHPFQVQHQQFSASVGEAHLIHQPCYSVFCWNEDGAVAVEGRNDWTTNPVHSCYIQLCWTYDIFWLLLTLQYRLLVAWRDYFGYLLVLVFAARIWVYNIFWWLVMLCCWHGHWNIKG